jgi:outer membrane protein OmpA-like peptidoglycan-associated protein
MGAGLLVIPVLFTTSWVNSAETRLEVAQQKALESPVETAVAAKANEAYCTPELKKILRRVLQSCGLIQGRSGRGCQPMDAKNVATMSGDDFNALFVPMAGRGGIVQFEQGSDQLDALGKALVEKVFSQRRGASYFFVVSRASPEGAVKMNRELSRNRAEQVMKHLDNTFKDAELQNQVGLLWLGEEFAQLDPSFCTWERSGAETTCTPEDLNRSSFITWIDCRL